MAMPSDGFSPSALTRSGFATVDLTDNDLAKDHVRYMVGGRSNVVSNERLFRFWFPERPGALARFLATMGADWNISLFHYRMHGGDFGRVLIGLELPDGQEREVKSFSRRARLPLCRGERQSGVRLVPVGFNRQG